MSMTGLINNGYLMCDTPTLQNKDTKTPSTPTSQGMTPTSGLTTLKKIRR